MVSRGTMAPPVSELLAASGAATPSMEPLPNSSGVVDVFFAAEQAMRDGGDVRRVATEQAVEIEHRLDERSLG